MKSSVYKITAFSAVLMLIINAPGLAQSKWTNNGIQAAISDASAVNVSAVPDGHGGFFMAYEIGSFSDTNIKAQWIDGGGNLRWGATGITVTNESLNQKNPVVAPDGSGGVYIAWVDESVDRIRVQRLDATGAPQWAGYGFYVTNTTATQSFVRVVSDATGGVILVWKDDRNAMTTGTDLWAQRLDNRGNMMWGTTGKVVSEAPDDQSQQSVISDGSGGILVTWQDYRNFTGANKIDVYVQHLTPSGTRSWHVSGNYNGLPVCTAAEDQLNPVIVKTGSKFCIAWQDNRGSSADIYAHMMEMSSSNTWSTANGTLVCGASGSQTNPEICGDINDYVIITWADGRTGTDVYAQRMNVVGSPQWTANGIPVINLSYYSGAQKIVSDGAGGAIITWMDNRSGNYDVYAQHFNHSGGKLWDTNGLALCTATGFQLYPKMITDGSGGAIAMWQDARSGAADIYAQLVNDNVTITAPQPGILWAGSQAQNITWSLRSTLLTFHHFNINASVTAGDGFPISVAQNVSPTALTQGWTAGSVNSSTVQLRFSVYNDQSVKLADFESGTFTVDSAPPSVFNLLSPSNGAVVDLQPAFQWQASTDNLSGLDHYELVVGGQTIQNDLHSTSYTLTSQEKLAGGTVDWYVKAVDGAGQIRQSATWSFTAAEDNTPPNPFNLVSPANNSWSQATNPNFTWETATDDITGIHHYKLFVDGSANPVADNIPPASTSINTVSLAVGSHTWYIIAVDSAANERQSTQIWTVKIDNVLPHAFDLTGPADNSWHQTATPTFAWQASQDDGSGLAEYELYIDGSGTPHVDNIASDVTQITLSAEKALPEGTHTWYVVAKDVLGNSRASSATYTIHIDPTPPTAFNLLTPGNSGYVNSPSPMLSWQASTDPTSGLAEYELCIDLTLNRDALNVTSSTPVSPLTEGEHSWQVKAIDNVGNITWSSLWHFTVDTQAPAAFTLISPSASQTVYHNKPTLSWQTTTDATSGFDHFELFVDDVKVAASLTAQQTQFTLVNALNNGTHTWKVMAFDKAGNSFTAGPQTFSTQVTAPVITSPNTAAATEDIFFSYTTTATDAENDLLTYAYENKPAWLNVNGATISGTPTEGVPSTSFTVKVSDGIFEVSQLVNVTVTPVDDAPQITSPASAEAVEDQPFTYTITATDPENDPITYAFSGYPVWMTVSGTTIQGSPPEGVTSVNFTASATANGKTTNLTVSISVAGVDDPPVITSSGTGNATEDINFTYTATATDPENDPIVFTFSGQPAWTSVSGAVIQGAPPEGVTSFSFTVTAAANGKSVQKSVNITVQQVDDAPEITSPATADATEDVPFTYTATATDAENDPITITFSQVPAWLTVSGTVIQGTPTEGVTSAVFTITATANGKTDQQNVTVTVQAVDDAPVLTSADSDQAVEDQAYTYVATATDTENDPITFAYSAYPDWMTVSAASIQGIPLNNVTAFSFTVTATANGKSDQQTVNVTVQAVNDPPVITSADTLFATEDQPFSYTAEAADEENDPLTVTLSNVPSWIQVDALTLTGTAVNGQQDTLFTITATSNNTPVSRDIVVKIVRINDPPVITSPDTAETTENQLFSYTVTTTDVDGPYLSVRFLNYPDWMSPMGRVIRGTVPANSQDTGFRIIVSDNHPANPLNDTLDVAVRIMHVNDPPKFDLSFPEPRFQDPDTVRWVISLDDYVTDPDNADSELTWTYMLIDSQRVVVWIDPVSHQASIEATEMFTDFRIAFTVTDPHQASASDTLRIGILSTGIAEQTGSAPREFVLCPNYPNPFNPATTIRFGLPRTSEVVLNVYNVMGQEIECLVDRKCPPGMYEVRWEAGHLPSGIYFTCIRTEHWHAIQRMVLLK
ncbi:VCBS domain-containing protein [bacterium]|nr:VCBS domain-containing protein [bacterium]